MGGWSRINIVDFVIDFILFIIILIWKTRTVFRQKTMRGRMTKRINAVIVERRESKWYEGPFHGYGYVFSGLNEYSGVTFDGRWSFRVKTRYEEGEMVSLLVNEFNPEEFWFEEAEEPGNDLIVWWIVVVAGIFICLPYIPTIIMNWAQLR